MDNVSKFAQKLLDDEARALERDRARRAEHKRAPQPELDPFQVTRWVKIAGSDPGYLPRIPMRMGKEGFWIACKACGGKFESKGLAYCESCMKLPAVERYAMQPNGRECQAPGCQNVIAPTARADAVYCSDACRKRARRETKDALSPDKNGAQHPDIGPPQNVRASEEKSEQNQWPKNEVRRMLDRPSRPDPYAALAPGELPDIPEFLKRPLT
jgi:hypothetical protein